MKTETEQLKGTAVHLKLDELIRALKDARNELVEFGKFIR